MARTSFPWRRKGRGWYVQLGGRQIPLGRDRDQAFAEYHRIMSELGRGEPLTPVGRVTLFELVDRYLVWKSAKAKPATIDYYRTYLESFLRLVGDGKPAEAVIVHDLTRWVAANPQWNPTTQSQVISAVQSVYRWSVIQGLIGRNPIAGAERPAKLTRKLYLTPEQQADLLALARQRKPFYDIVATMLLTGCRPQEARLVETKNVRTDHWLWHWNAGEAPKGSAARTVFLAGEAEAITQERMAKGEGPLFRGLRGHQWTANGLHSLFYRYGEKLKIKGLKPYTLRHAFVTNALLKKTHPEILRVLTGHSSLAMISKHYSHIDQCAADMKRAAAEAVKSTAPT